MKYAIFFITILLVANSCQFKGADVVNSKFCNNELYLLCDDSVAPLTRYDIVKIREDVWSKFESVFDDYFCRQVKLKVEFNVEGNDPIKLLLYSNNHEQCDISRPVPPPFNPFVHWIHIYLKDNDTVYVRSKLSTLDSIKSKVIMRYHELTIEKYKRVNIALLWDSNTNPKKLTQMISDCIDGYVFIANEVCDEMFQKPLCELDSRELELLNHMVPFKLRTDFSLERFGNCDYVPYNIPPPPIDTLMKVLNINE